MKRNIGLLVAMVAFAVGLAIPGIVSGQAVDPELRKAIDTRDAARNKRNFDEWSRYTADDYVLTDAAGVLRTKAEQLASMKANQAPVQPPDRRHDERFHSYGSTAILTLTVDSQAGSRRETHVWVKQGGQWKVAAVHMTLVAKR